MMPERTNESDLCRANLIRECLAALELMQQLPLNRDRAESVVRHLQAATGNGHAMCGILKGTPPPVATRG